MSSHPYTVTWKDGEVPSEDGLQAVDKLLELVHTYSSLARSKNRALGSDMSDYSLAEVWWTPAFDEQKGDDKATTLHLVHRETDQRLSSYIGSDTLTVPSLPTYILTSVDTAHVLAKHVHTSAEGSEIKDGDGNERLRKALTDVYELLFSSTSDSGLRKHKNQFSWKDKQDGVDLMLTAVFPATSRARRVMDKVTLPKVLHYCISPGKEGSASVVIAGTLDKHLKLVEGSVNEQSAERENISPEPGLMAMLGAIQAANRGTSPGSRA